MKKKWWILLGGALGIIVIFVILCFTLFALKSVRVNYRTSISHLLGQEQQIVDSGNFNYGKPVLFLGKRASIEKIERENPYVKVINIETKFPCEYVINCAERQEVYYLELNNKFYICDQEFKVLKVQDVKPDQLMEYSGLRVNNSNAVPGEFLKIDNQIDVYNAFIESNRLLHEQNAIIKSLEVGTSLDEVLNKEQAYVKLNFQDGQTYIIKNATYGLKYKVAKMLEVYSQIFTIIGQPIDKDLPADEENVWTMDKIRQSTIVINNYYRTDLHGENECYFNVLPPQNSVNI